MTEDPIKKFASWQEKAKQQQGILEPTAACLATVNKYGQPSARIILVKHVDERGFVFYTNLESRKSDDLKATAKAALCFHWMPLKLQVRVEGNVERVSDAEADAYFATRPRESRIGAWSSKQSRPLSGRDELVRAVADNTQKFEGKDVPRPLFWSGWRVVPQAIEFWEDGQSRLHERALYTKKGNGWDVVTLYP
jgi:pyridoxamine 5'-phosphate oxidase